MAFSHADRTWALLACLALDACGGGGSETRTARPATICATTGTVQVDVRFDGTPSAMQELRMSGFPSARRSTRVPCWPATRW
jgi:hypothetical protein